MLGYLREDGSKGIRNITAVVYLVECAHHVAREIVLPFRDQNVHLIGFSGCYPNAHASTIVRRLCTHPNVGAVLLVSLGCESFIRRPVEQAVRDSGRPLETLTIQQVGGTRQSIERGRQWIEDTLPVLAAVPRIEMAVSDLIIGTICGGSDATSGMTANPAIGAAFDRFIDEGAACIFEETGELIGCEQFLSRRAATPELGQAMVDSIRKAERYYDTLGHGSFASGNSLGELTTQEEKSLGAYCKSGTRPISGLLHPGDQPPGGGLYLLDVVPDGEVRYGFPNINDNLEITELIACGSHVTLFATGRGSVVGSAIAPVINICGNQQTYHRMSEDMDVNAGAILEGTSDLEAVSKQIYDLTVHVASGKPSCSEALGHQEFCVTYKSFEPLGPSCLAR